jgi:hypothetical protein
MILLKISAGAIRITFSLSLKKQQVLHHPNTESSLRVRILTQEAIIYDIKNNKKQIIKRLT